MYKLSGSFLSLLRRLLPRYVTTTQELGQALLAAAKYGTEKRVVTADEIGTLLESLQKDLPPASRG
jgi:hypothetical protein